MFRTVFLTLATLAIAIGGGAASVWYTLQAQEGIGAVTIGNWTAYPNMGAPDADPYSKARAAREGILALGRAEGPGLLLQPRCRRRHAVAQMFLPDRRRHAAGPVLDVLCGRPVAGDACRRPPAQAGANSLAILRNPDNSFAITVGPDATPGNWLSVSGDGPMVFVLTFYDTPVSGSTGIADIELPQVLRTGCHA